MSDDLRAAADDDEANVEAGDYIEDEPQTWAAWVGAIRRYGPTFAALSGHLGSEDAAAEVLAGTILSYLASEHGVYLRDRAALAPPEPDVDVDAAWEALLGDDHIYASSAFRRDAIARHRPRIEAALRHAPDLDVPRLAEALAAAEVGCVGFAGGFHDGNDPADHHLRDAESIAREYAALRDKP